MFATLLLVSLAVIPPILALEGLQYSETFSHEKRDESFAVTTWSYTGTNGPLNWHHLDKKYFLCATGRNQSPIRIIKSNSTITKKNFVKLEIPDTKNAVLMNLGNTIEVTVEGTMTVGDEKWSLKQFHFHTPSEHLVDDHHYEGEMHLVFGSATGNKKAVIALFIRVDESFSNPLLPQVFSKLEKIKNPNTKITVPLRFSGFLKYINQKQYYQYMGSLTTPPCTEQVLWLVDTHQIHVTLPLYYNLLKVMQTNNRYVQNDPGEPNLLEVAAGGPVKLA